MEPHVCIALYLQYSTLRKTKACLNSCYIYPFHFNVCLALYLQYSTLRKTNLSKLLLHLPFPLELP